MVSSLFQQHWQAALESHEDQSRYEIVEIGWEQHVLIDHKQNLVYRYPRRQSAANKLKDEVGLLKALNEAKLPLRIPVMRDHNEDYAVYDYIEGDVLSDEVIATLNIDDFENIGQDLGNFLRALHSMDPQIVKNKINRQTTSLLNYYEKRIMSSSKGSTHYKLAKSDLDRLLDYEFSAEVVVHGDLHGLNMVIDPSDNKLVGIIDFSEVELGDPNQDFRKIFMADERFLRPAVKSYQKENEKPLSEEKIKLWAYVNEWSNICHFEDRTEHPTYVRAKNHLTRWGKF